MSNSTAVPDLIAPPDLRVHTPPSATPPSATPPSALARGAFDDGEVSAHALADVLVRHRRLIGAAAVGLAAVAAAVGLITPRQWSSAAAFLPQGRGGGGATSGLSGLAAQFGVAVPTLEPTQSPGFYQDLLRTNVFLGALVDSGLAGTGPASRARSVADLYDVEEADPALRRALAIDQLADHLEVGTSPKTGIVRVVVRAPDAAAAQQLAERALAEVTRFNVETRQSQAAAERRFVERRMAEARGELRAAEARLRDFVDANRVVSSAGLTLEHERLLRDVSLRQDVYSTLAQNYERARIDEVRDTPVITVVEAPARAVRPDPRGLLRRTLLFLVGGALIGCVLAFVVDFMRSLRGARAAERAEFAVSPRHAGA